jgi:hypothetical protein
MVTAESDAGPRIVQRSLAQSSGSNDPANALFLRHDGDGEAAPADKRWTMGTR